MSRPRVVVIGLGNLLLGDEGLAIHALSLLRERPSLPRARLVDGGTLGLSLLPLMEDASHLLLLDAVRASGRPGTIVELSAGELVASQPLKFSAHDVSLTDLLALLELRSGERRRRICLLGMIPGTIRPDTELSADVRASLPALVDRVEDRLRDWCRERPGTDLAERMPAADALEGEAHVPGSTRTGSVR